MTFPSPGGGGGGGNVSTPLPTSDPGTTGTLWDNGGFVIVSHPTPFLPLSLQANKYQDVTISAGPEGIYGLVLTTGTKSNGISLRPGSGAPGYAQGITLLAGKAFDTSSPAGSVSIAAQGGGANGGDITIAPASTSHLYLEHIPTTKGAKGSVYLDTITNGLKLSP